MVFINKIRKFTNFLIKTLEIFEEKFINNLLSNINRRDMKW